MKYELKNNPFRLELDGKIYKSFTDKTDINSVVKYVSNVLDKEDIIVSNNSFFLRKLKGYCIIEKSSEPLIPEIIKSNNIEKTYIEIYTNVNYLGFSNKENTWSYKILDKGYKIFEYTGYFVDQSQNRIELISILTSLEKTLSIIKPNRKIICYTSQYIADVGNLWLNKWSSNGWKTIEGYDIQNKDLWMRISDLKSNFKNLKFKLNVPK